ncbi:MAG: nicotinamide mononucleotide transporter [Lentimicrobiaceae bacterium]|nr:nicotinamide mononucleotide transporter [Lentimicrobiaceae bacterium]
MNYELILEIIAVITGMLSIWYSYRINILVYPIGMISLALYVFIFIKNGLYANAVINFLYFVISIFGWWNWLRQRTTDNGQQTTDKGELKVSYLSKKENAITITILVILIFFINLFTTNDLSIRLDYYTSAAGLIAMVLTSFKKVENWFFYLVADIVLIPLCIYNGLYLTSIQYVAYTILAIMGYINWNKEAKKNV